MATDTHYTQFCEHWSVPGMTAVCICDRVIQVETHTFDNLPYTIKQIRTRNLLGCKIMCALKDAIAIRVRDGREKQGEGVWVRWGLLSGEGFTK